MFFLKKTKNLVLVILVLILVCVPIISNATPAPHLKEVSVSVTDDPTKLTHVGNVPKDSCYIVVEEIGFSGHTYLYKGSSLLYEQNNDYKLVKSEVLTEDSSNIGIGMLKIYKLNRVYNGDSGTITVKAYDHINVLDEKYASCKYKIVKAGNTGNTRNVSYNGKMNISGSGRAYSNIFKCNGNTKLTLTFKNRYPSSKSYSINLHYKKSSNGHFLPFDYF